jgi:hypothetical protein
MRPLPRLESEQDDGAIRTGYSRTAPNDHGACATPKNVSRVRHDRFPHPGPSPEGELERALIINPAKTKRGCRIGRYKAFVISMLRVRCRGRLEGWPEL